MENKTIKGDIAIVGYPKSGNTWITRLISRSLNLKVAKYIPGDFTKTPEMASDLNKEIINTTSDHVVRKIHLNPDGFQKKIKGVRYIIYIKRDPKSVFISAFFYFKYHEDKEYAMKFNQFFSIFKIMKWIRGRYLLSKFLNEFITLGIVPFGRCDEHIDKWRYHKNKIEAMVYEIDYNELLSNTKKTIEEIFDFFEIEYSQSDIVSAIKKEDFINRKVELLSADERFLTFGKKFNEKFLRSGSSEDWKQYLNKNQSENLGKLAR